MTREEMKKGLKNLTKTELIETLVDHCFKKFESAIGERNTDMYNWKLGNYNTGVELAKKGLSKVEENERHI